MQGKLFVATRRCQVSKDIDSKSIASACNITVVDLEPTHYKTDLWNVFSNSKKINLFVIYSQLKNWSPDGGHNYLKFPEKKYSSFVYEGRDFFGTLKSAISIARKIYQYDSDVVIVYGYAHVQMMFAIFTSFILRKNFLLFVDEFNNKWPTGKLALFKWIARESLRLFTFKFADAVLVCGRQGIRSAIESGCSPKKIYDFPYVVDLERILSDTPESIPDQCLADMGVSRTILFFSGRMIARKGLPSLLLALSNKNMVKDWSLWIEGDGPELDNYITLAQQYGIDDRCHFLGFCQYDLHSWLIRSSDIVIVPSLEDNWGIVVDEGLQLGKLVVSSDATGSGRDRIIDKVNGYLFPADDSNALAIILSVLLNDHDNEASIVNAAKFGEQNVTPADNLNSLLNIIRGKIDE